MSKLVDSDVLIDYLRGQPEAITWLEAEHEGTFVSAMSVAELFQGVREGSERRQLDMMLSAFTVLPITAAIAERGGLLRRQYARAHGCGLGDCLIAATAEEHDLELVTMNVRHFPMLVRVAAPYGKQ